ncbi:hypothetical protein [Brevibacillus sp. 179-C9.3 HS]|uniref:hypothetical protein n=1 Tax=unclassified Brevibacillus TaxID=2684853 RepID=UPI0039A25B4F
MVGNKVINAVLACTLCFTTMFLFPPATNIAEAKVTSYQITYKLPHNPEKYLFLNKQMVSIANPLPTLSGLRPYSFEDYLIDMETKDTYYKLYLQYRLNFLSSKKGFLWNIYHFIGTLAPAYPADVDLDQLDIDIMNTSPFSDEGRALRESRAQINMNARLQPLIQAGYVMPNEIDDGVATKEFVATVLYRMFGATRPYHGGIDLKDSENVAVRWAVEVGLPGFVVDKEGYIYPQTPLSMDPGPEQYAQEYAYDRLFHFITLIMPGKKTDGGWEYYQVKLYDDMLPTRADEMIYVNGKPAKDHPNFYSIQDTKEYQNVTSKIYQHFVPRFPQTIDLARKDAMKPRVWDWSRDLIHNPKFSKQMAAYRKNKSSKNVNAVYQAVRQQYNLNRAQDSAAIIKSVLDNVK